MAGIRELVENKDKLSYEELCKALIEQFAVSEKVNWESLLPPAQQQELFGGEILRLVADHPQFKNQKDIRPVSLVRGTISQLLFFFVRLEKNELPKVDIQRLTNRFIRGEQANRYIIWFFGNKDETKLKVVLSGKEGKKVVLKTLPFGTNEPYYKTYNFILSEVQAKVHRMFAEPTDLWKALWAAFDISILNKNFYKEIKDAFDELLKQLNRRGNPFKTGEDRVQFAIRLIGRIIFCWFLKRKGILKNDALSSGAVTTHQHKNYYHDLLEILFFDVLNTPDKERKAGLPKIIAHYPFLNGGLFEAQETDYKDNELLNIDNDWFQNFFGNTLEKYNFTVDENSSSDEEIAIEPEMLGRIFENLLAEQNPDTGETARKATGSYYTPREIVDYMVETSIVEYLQNYFPQTLHSDILDFVHEVQIPDSIKDKGNEILKYLNEVRVLDPACGSGAFPMGILQKLVMLKTLLEKGKNHYQIKLETIENSIYGSDIQPMATELSRLRCWLSLVVDEDIRNVKTLPNLEFKFITANSIIDLGFDDFVQKAHKQGAMFFSDLFLKVDELKKIRDNFFEISTQTKQKEILKNDFKKLQRELIIITNKLIKSDPKSEPIISKFADKLLLWNPFDDSKVAPFFSKAWMFGIEEGFDIVIGNPPYIKEYTNRSAFDGVRDSHYYQGKMDIWYLFACRFLDNLKPNSGILTFIATNNWVTNSGASKFRNKVAKDAQIIQLIDFGNYKIFESADIQTMIMVFKSHKQHDAYDFDYRKITDTQATLDDVIAILNKSNSDKQLLLQPVFTRTYFKDKSFLFTQAENENILDAILEAANFKLDEKKEIAQGIVAPQDFVNNASFTILGKGFRIGQGIFNLTDEEKKNLNLTSNEIKLIKPFYTTEELGRYYGNKKNKLWVIYTDSSFKNSESIKPYPNLKKHFDRFRDVITSDNAPYGLHRARNDYFFKGEKIISLRKCAVPTFTYTDFDCYVSQTYFVIKTERVNQKYLTAILNSKVIAFWLRHRGKMQGFQYQVDKAPLVELPLIKIDNTKVFEHIVDYIIFINKNGKKQLFDFVTNEHVLNTFDDVLNGCVFELYFGKEMKQKKIDILDECRKLIKPISIAEEDTEQLRVIRDIYNKLKEANNEIRNRMKLFAIESKDTLLPILKIY